MPKTNRSGALVLLCLLSGCATARSPQTPSEAMIAAASEIAAAGIEQQGIPGAALVVMQGDEILLARGYGVEDAARPDLVTPESVFALGSITKQFVAAAILQLVDEGKLRLDDPVSSHLRDFTRLPAGLEVRHLLSHTSGMREEMAQPELRALFAAPDTTFERYLEVARHTPSDFAPGARWSYSNVNYLMLTVILERITGKPLAAALTERLFAPLGLQSIGQCRSPIGEVRGEARGHVKRGDALVPHPPENIELFRGSGGFCGNALDLARWFRAMAAGRVISRGAYERMTTRVSLDGGRVAEYGFATDLGTHDGIRRFGHGGYGGGYSAQAAWYPDHEIAIVLLTNRFAFAEHIERKIARRLMSVPDPVLREVALDATQRQGYTGRYDIGVTGQFVDVVDRDGRLWFELTQTPIKLPLMYLGNDEFVSALEPDGYRLRFAPDKDEFSLLGMGMMTWYGSRKN